MCSSALPLIMKTLISLNAGHVRSWGFIVITVSTKLIVKFVISAMFFFREVVSISYPSAMQIYQELLNYAFPNVLSVKERLTTV